MWISIAELREPPTKPTDRKTREQPTHPVTPQTDLVSNTDGKQEKKMTITIERLFQVLDGDCNTIVASDDNMGYIVVWAHFPNELRLFNEHLDEVDALPLCIEPFDMNYSEARRQACQWLTDIADNTPALDWQPSDDNETPWGETSSAF
jgi:hypothetical protein